MDNQIATYLPDVDHFLSADSAFIDVIEHLRPLAPCALAQVERISGESGQAVAEILQVLLRAADRP